MLCKSLNAQLDGLDAWAKAQTETPSRPEAIRQILALFINGKGTI